MLYPDPSCYNLLHLGSCSIIHYTGQCHTIPDPSWYDLCSAIYWVMLCCTLSYAIPGLCHTWPLLHPPSSLALATSHFSRHNPIMVLSHLVNSPSPSVWCISVIARATKDQFLVTKSTCYLRTPLYIPNLDITAGSASSWASLCIKL